MTENNKHSKKNKNVSTFGLIYFIWKNRKLILWITAFGFVISLVISLILTPIYKSTAIIFPAATSTVSFSEQRNAKSSSMDFGEEEQAEQMVQILQSASIRDRIVNEFDLLKHYKISEDAVNKRFKLINKFNNNFEFARTRYGSIQIDVSDIDPKKAAEMANRIVDLIDTVKNEMIWQRTSEAFKIASRKRQMLQSEIDAINIQLDSLSKLGVKNIDERSGLYQAYVDSKSSNEKNEIKEKILINEKYGSKYDELEQYRMEKITAYELFLAVYEQAESDANTKLNHKFIVEKAVVADKKDRPKRLIVTLLGTIGTFIFIIFLLLVRDKIRELKNIDKNL